jgi:tryptophan synthase alpha chain
VSGKSDSGRIGARFAALKAENRAALVAFVTAGDPDDATSRAILAALPEAGADLIELGMPFSDPVGDGPAIQLASERALAAGANMRKTLAMVRDFREQDDETPIVLMGYFNPIYSYGAETFARDAAAVGVDGLIVIDLPPEEEEEDLRPFTDAAGLHMVRLVTPTSDDARLALILKGAGGFVYHVAVTGITGTRAAAIEEINTALAAVRRHTTLPLAVGFGIRTPAQAAEVAQIADAAAVGTAIVEAIAAGLGEDGKAGPGLVEGVAKRVRALAEAVHSARAMSEA